MTIEEKILSLGLTLPTVPKPVASYVPAKRVGNLLYISGQLPTRDGQIMAFGKFGPAELPPAIMEGAHAAARQCVLNALAIAKAELGDLSAMKGVVRLGVFVQSSNTFKDQHKVANGASDLIVEIFGDAGKHVRAAVGVNALPLNAAVEIEFIFEI